MEANLEISNILPKSSLAPLESSVWNEIPIELIVYLFEFFDVDTFKTASCVCRSWHVVSQDNRVWKVFAQKFRFDIFNKSEEMDWKDHCKKVLRNEKNWLRQTAEAGCIRSVIKLNDPKLVEKFIKIFYTQDEYGHLFQLLYYLPEKGPGMCNDLGYMFQYGLGVPKDVQKALKFYIKSRVTLNHTAFYRLGILSEEKKDYEEAFKYFEKAANLGNSHSLSEIAKCYEFGWGVPKDLDKAIEYYLKSGNSEKASSVYHHLGWIFEQGKGVEKDEKKAVEYYKKAADLGNPIAKNDLGYCYCHGIGVDKDLDKAKKYLKEAANLNCSSAYLNLGWLYLEGKDAPINPTKGIECYKKAYELGNIQALPSLGYRYDKGLGVPVDYEKALDYYRQGEKLGCLVSLNNLGTLYEHGNGVPKDLERALQYYKEAAEGGEERSMYHLGRCYQNGIGVEANLETAISWYEQAAKKGENDAKKALASFEVV